MYFCVLFKFLKQPCEVGSVVITQFLRLRDQGIRKLSSLTKAIWVVNGGVRSEPRVSISRALVLTVTLK